MNLDEKLARVVAHHHKLGEDLAGHPDPGSAEYTRLAKDYADLGPVVEAVAVSIAVVPVRGAWVPPPLIAVLIGV